MTTPEKVQKTQNKNHKYAFVDDQITFCAWKAVPSKE